MRKTARRKSGVRGLDFEPLVARYHGAFNDNRYWYKGPPPPMGPARRLLHREDGPAIERLDGSKVWIENGCVTYYEHQGESRSWQRNP